MPRHRRAGLKLRDEFAKMLPAGAAWSASERQAMATAERLADEIEVMQRSIEVEGVLVDTDRGGRKKNPALGAIQGHRAMLVDLVHKIERGHFAPASAGRSAAKSHAASRRWSSKRDAEQDAQQQRTRAAGRYDHLRAVPDDAPTEEPAP